MSQPTKSNQEFSNIFTTLKVLILLFCIIPVIQQFFAEGTESETLTFNLSKMVSFFVIISLITVFWFVVSYAFKNPRLRAITEIAVMYGVGFLCYYSTGLSQSSYKFIFALIILIYTMELGIRFGMIFSFAAGGVVAIGDLLSCPYASRSVYFQADLMLTGTFCLLAYIVGSYVEKDKKIIRTLKDSANRDSLTGLFNHRFFHQKMHEIIDKTPEEKQYLLMMDIDNFKVYNDTLGHQKGDAVLKKIAEICLDCIPTGTVFRYGGEEFSVYLCAKDEKEAMRMANSLRLAIADCRFEAENLMPGHRLTVSIGVAEKKESGDTVADWIERADNALYKAKFFRKNRVQMYSSVFDRFDHLDQIDDDERIISIRTLLSVINSRDRYTYNHTDRVVHYCEIFAKYAKLSEENSRKLLYGAYLHDIGKINVPQEILISEKKLTDEQWAQMKRHPVDGADIVRKIKNFDAIAEIVQQHHEKFNGTGYPEGLAGKQIHYLARVLTLADSFDAMTAKRPYQKVKTFEEAFEEIRRCKGTHFDPQLAEVFIASLEDAYFSQMRH